MGENKLPQFESLDELTQFFETNDLGEFDLPEAHFDVDIQHRRCWVAVDERLMGRLVETARRRHTSAGELVNSWIEEKVAQVA